jgi:signal transduction histidine kinase
VSVPDEVVRRLRHDVRTPLMIIGGFADVLASDREVSDADRREYAARIQDATAELRAMLDEALDQAAWRAAKYAPPPSARS